MSKKADGGIRAGAALSGRNGECRLDTGGTPCRIEQSNLLEETEALLLERGTHLDLTLQAFGSVTLRIV